MVCLCFFGYGTWCVCFVATVSDVNVLDQLFILGILVLSFLTGVIFVTMGLCSPVMYNFLLIM